VRRCVRSCPSVNHGAPPRIGNMALCTKRMPTAQSRVSLGVLFEYGSVAGPNVRGSCAYGPHIPRRRCSKPEFSQSPFRCSYHCLPCCNNDYPRIYCNTRETHRARCNISLTISWRLSARNPHIHHVGEPKGQTSIRPIFRP
jgi:hypothetical protein